MLTTNNLRSGFARRAAASCLLALAALLWHPARARAQWTTPDSSNNIHSTNSGNVGVGTTSPVTALETHGTGSFGGDVLTGAGGLASPFGGIGLVQNLLPYSETIGGTGWNLQNGASAAQNSATAPDGNATAAKLVCGSTNSSAAYVTLGAASGGAYTFSFWAKAGNSSKIQYGIYDLTTLTWVTFIGVTDLDSNWRRLVATGTPPAGHNVQVYIYPDTAGGAVSNYNYVWGAQVTGTGTAGVYARTAGSQVSAFYGGVVYGNLGIGKAVPAYKLDVAGSVNGTGLCIAGDCKSAWSQVGGSSQWTNSGTNIYFNTGNVGVGAPSPDKLLTVQATLPAGAVPIAVIRGTGTNNGVGLALDAGGTGNNNVAFSVGNVTKASFAWDVSRNFLGFINWNYSSNDFALRLNSDGSMTYHDSATGTERFRVTAAGDMNATGTITGGNIQAKYQDVAEWVPSTQKLPAGTVVVLDTTQANHVLASTTPYDTSVAGVVSRRPGIALGEGGEGKLLVATTGRVRVKVDATRAPVRVGDLLVTSDLPGVAMRSEPVVVGGRRMHAPGTIIGKALEPLAGGTGEILVLLSLQ